MLSFLKLFYLITLLVLLTPISLAFSGGDGTEQNPYQISNWSELNEIREDLSAHYILINNLSKTDEDYLEIGDYWQPIGECGPENQCLEEDYSFTFSGSLRGNGYLIKDLIINQAGSDFLGLFGFSRGIINGLRLREAQIIGNDFISILVGRNKGKVLNSSATGKVSGNKVIGGLIGLNDEGALVANSWVKADIDGEATAGGLIGINEGEVNNTQALGDIIIGQNNAGGLIGEGQGKVSNSYATGNVGGVENVGGLIGFQLLGQIDHSYATGIVESEKAGGGLIGLSGADISNSYTAGSISGLENIGGLIGYQLTGEVIDSYSISSVQGDNHIGGLIGKGQGVINNSFWDIEVSGQDYSAGGEGKTSAEMKNLDFYLNSNWDIKTFNFDYNNGYPFLAWQGENSSASWLIYQAKEEAVKEVAETEEEIIEEIIDEPQPEVDQTEESKLIWPWILGGLIVLISLGLGLYFWFQKPMEIPREEIEDESF